MPNWFGRKYATWCYNFIFWEDLGLASIEISILVCFVYIGVVNRRMQKWLLNENKLAKFQTWLQNEEDLLILFPSEIKFLNFADYFRNAVIVWWLKLNIWI